MFAKWFSRITTQSAPRSSRTAANALEAACLLQSAGASGGSGGSSGGSAGGSGGSSGGSTNGSAVVQTGAIGISDATEQLFSRLRVLVRSI